MKSEEKVLALCHKLEATQYINSIGGQELYHRDTFRAQQIQLNFIRSRPLEYAQFGNDFIPWLSIADVMMFNFELALPPASGEYHTHGLRLQSARNALLALLQHGRPTAVWMPWYICDSMLEPLLACGIPVKHYALDSQLGIAGDIPLAAGEWLLYVNYFGLCQQHAEHPSARATTFG